MKACLERLGLEPNSTVAAVPSLSNLHLSSMSGREVTEMLCAWDDVSEEKGDVRVIRGESDTYQIREVSGDLHMDELEEALPNAPATTGAQEYEAPVKAIFAYDHGLPSTKRTPHFDHKLFYTSLEESRLLEEGAKTWGNTMLYGDVVTSTNTVLHRSVVYLPRVRSLAANNLLSNPKLFADAPNGFTMTATTQIAGRGRGSNVWIAPPGMLIFSTLINHPAHLTMSRPIVFIQYIACIAVVEAIQAYGQGYEKLPIKIKWPNDLCEYSPTSADKK